MDYQQANTGNSMEIDLNSNSMEVDGSVGMLTGGVVKAVAEVAVSSETKQAKYPGAGKLNEEGKHRGYILGNGFVDVGGFDVPKTEATLYKEIWLKYAHIASSEVLPDTYYSSQVTVVSDLMSFIVKMNAFPLEEVSSKVINDWERNIRVAEKLEFNISWLRKRLEDIKLAFAEEKKLRKIVAEQDEAKARVIEAEQQLFLAKEGLSSLETKIRPLQVVKQNFRDKCGGPLLLFNNATNLSPDPAPIQEDAFLNEEPNDSKKSNRGSPTGIARKIRFKIKK